MQHAFEAPDEGFRPHGRRAPRDRDGGIRLAPSGRLGMGIGGDQAALLANGLITLTLAALVWKRGGPAAAATGTTVATLDAGILWVTATATHGDVARVHAAAETLLAPALVHVALVFPIGRLGRWRRGVLAASYAVGALAVAAHGWLSDPASAILRDAGRMAAAAAAAGILTSAVHASVTTTSPLVRQQIGVAALGIIAGAGVARCLAPASLAYAVIQRDVFVVAAARQRLVATLLVAAVGGATYAAGVVALERIVPTWATTASTLAAGVLGVTVAGVVLWLRERAHRRTGRFVHRGARDARKTLARAAPALAATADLDDIATLTVEIVCQALIVRDASLWLRTGEAYALAHEAGAAPALRGPIAATHPVITHLRRGRRILSSYDVPIDRLPTWDERRCARGLRDLGADLIVPVGSDQPVGFLAVGPKESGALFTITDVRFLRAFTEQVALAVRQARAHEPSCQPVARA